MRMALATTTRCGQMKEYARRRNTVGLLLLPLFSYGFDRIASGYVGGLPGIHANVCRYGMEWCRVIRPEIAFPAKHLKALIEKPGFCRTDDSADLTHGIHRSKQRVGRRADSWCMRVERDTAVSAASTMSNRLNILLLRSKRSKRSIAKNTKRGHSSLLRRRDSGREDSSHHQRSMTATMCITTT